MTTLALAQGSDIPKPEPGGSATVFRLTAIGVDHGRNVGKRRASRQPARGARRKQSKSTASRRSATTKKPSRWSQHVTLQSDALDLKRGADEREEDCRIPQTFSRAQYAPQSERLSFGACDAGVLHQSGRQKLAEDTTRSVAARQDRIEASVLEESEPCVDTTSRATPRGYWP